MNIAIGIISYLPDTDIRELRTEKLNNLLKRCDELFGLPIIVIAQNWKDIEISKLNKSKIILYNYNDGLGITKARRALREVFINSEYDYLIMLDDDILLKGELEDSNNYIEQINEHPNMYCLFKLMTLQLFAISKEVYKLIDFPELEPGNGDYFEDMYLIMALNKLYCDKKYIFKRYNLDAIANSTDCVTSTWYKGQSRHLMGDRTRSMISAL